MSEYYEQRNKWLTETNDVFLKSCKIESFQGTGPGGQKRNKKFSAVRLVHSPSGLIATSEKSRSQLENRNDAVRKLRFKIATLLSGPKIKIAADIFVVSKKNNLYFCAIAKVFDALYKCNFQVSKAASELEISTGKLVKFFSRESKLYQRVNQERKKRNFKPLK